MRAGRILIAIACLVPAAWAILRRPPEDNLVIPADANAPIRRREILPSATVNRAPLDAAARAEGERSLDRLRARWRAEYEASLRSNGLRCGWRSPSIFAHFLSTGQTERSLFVTAYPEIAEAWAVEAVADPEAIWERYYAIFALGRLALNGFSRAEAALVERAREGDGEERLWPLALLAFDLSSHRALFRERAREGDYSAILPLVEGAAEEDLAMFRDTLTRWRSDPSPRGSCHYEAQEALERVTILKEDRLRTALRACRIGQMDCHSRFRWLVEQARSRRAPWLVEELRGRMRPPEEGDYDEVLLALLDCGAALSESERNYLSRHGYGGEPRARLKELLKEQGYPE